MHGEAELAAALAGGQLTVQPAAPARAAARPGLAADRRPARRRCAARESSLRRGRWRRRGRTCLAAWSTFAPRANRRPPARSPAARRSPSRFSHRVSWTALRRRPASNSISASHIRRQSEVGHWLRLVPVAAAKRLTRPSGEKGVRSNLTGTALRVLRSKLDLTPFSPRGRRSARSTRDTRARCSHRPSLRLRPATRGRRRRFAWPSGRRTEAANSAAHRSRCTKDRACRSPSAGRAA